MCLKNDSNLWFKIDTIESVLLFFLFYNYVLARSVRDTMSGTVERCGWGMVFQQQQDKTLISVEVFSLII